MSFRLLTFDGFACVRNNSIDYRGEFLTACQTICTVWFPGRLGPVMQRTTSREALFVEELSEAEIEAIRRSEPSPDAARYDHELTAACEEEGAQ